MSDAPRGYGHSACVSLDLRIEGRTISLHEIAPDSVWLREPIDLPPCDATIVMTVDGARREWPVYLPDGLSTNSRAARTIDRQPPTVVATSNAAP